MRRKIVSEWSRTRSSIEGTTSFGGRRLSAEPFSYRYLVARTITSNPVQSAIAFPKNDPIWVLGSETLYREIHSANTAAELMLSECSRKKLRLRERLSFIPSLPYIYLPMRLVCPSILKDNEP